MPDATPTPPCQASPTDPPTDRDARALPANLAHVLRIVQILLTYGRHLADTFARRSAAPGFHLIARHFGTSRPAIILAHIRRGILRAAALERVLLERAARGRDLTIRPPRVRIRPAVPKSAAQPATNPPDPPAAPKPKPIPSWHDDWLDNVADPLDPRHLPTFEHLLAQARRRPIGRSISDICGDLGIAPSLSHAPFWNDLFNAIMYHGGNPAIWDLRRWRREMEFVKAQDRSPTMDLSWPKLEAGPGRGHVIQVLGFFTGQDPVEPPLILPPQEAQNAEVAPPAPPAPRPQAPWVTPPAPRTAAKDTRPP